MAQAFGIDKNKEDDDLIRFASRCPFSTARTSHTEANPPPPSSFPRPPRSSLKTTALAVSENLNRKDAGDFENVEPDSILAPSVRFPFRPQSFSLFDSGRTQSCRGLRIGENFRLFCCAR